MALLQAVDEQAVTAGEAQRQERQADHFLTVGTQVICTEPGTPSIVPVQV